MPSKQKVLLSLLNDRQSFQLKQAEDARAAAAQAGLELTIVFADNNPIVQILQLFEVINARREDLPLAVITETAAVSGLERAAVAAVKIGIGWVELESNHAPYLDDLRGQFPGVLISSAFADDEEIGRMEAKQYQALLPRGGRILYVEGPNPSPSARLRRRAFDAARRSLGIEVMTTLRADWTETGAERAMASWLRLRASRNLQPDLIGSQNDAMAFGARKAIVEKRPEWAQIPMLGCDGLPDEGQRLVKQGVLAATIMKPPTAGVGVELVARSLRGEAVPPSVTLPPIPFPSLQELARAAQNKELTRTEPHTALTDASSPAHVMQQTQRTSPHPSGRP